MDINKYLEEIEVEEYLKKKYGGPLIENISIIRPIYTTYDLCDILKIPTFELLTNSAFKKLFRYIISCYGIHKNNILFDLMIQNFIDTVKKKRRYLNYFVKEWLEK